ncbi:MAG: macro domain-containing protein [Solirubrobacterales bacterium]
MTHQRPTAAHTVASGQTIQLIHGDITVQTVDAIVNAADERLQHGGGVAGAIASRGGPEIQSESNQIGRVPTGQAALTGPGKLNAKCVIHAVGPIYRSGDKTMPELLYSAATNSLQLAEHHRLRSIAFPAISSGIFGYPKTECASILLQAVIDFCSDNPSSILRDIRFVIIDQPTVDIFLAEMQRRFAP